MAIRLASRTRLPADRRPARTTRPTALIRPDASLTDIPAWTTGGSLTGATLGAMTLTTTYRSINIELLFTESVANSIVSAVAEVRPAGSGTAVTSLPLWPTRPSTGATGIYGKLLFLTHNTAYQVRVAVVDASGGVGYVAGTATTRNDAIPAASSLVPTHFERTDGNDSNDGLTDASGGAWLTLAKVKADAPSGAVVQLGPGHFKGLTSSAATNGFTSPVTLMAKFPALDDDREQINVGNWTFIDGEIEASPTASGGPNAGPWTSVSIQGAGIANNYAGGVVPDPVPSYQLWKWENVHAGLTSVNRLRDLGYAASRDALPKRLVNWRADDTITTPAQFAEYLYTNQEYRYGFWLDAVTLDDIYLRLPGDVDPNTLWWVGGWNWVVAFNGADSRITGCVVRGGWNGIGVGTTGHRTVIDHNISTTSRYPVHSQGTATARPANVTVEHNYLHDSSMWSDNQATDSAAPWVFLKQNLILANDPTPTSSTATGTGPDNPGIWMQGSGVGGRHPGRDFVVRRNTIRGTFNCINVGDVSGSERYNGSGWDVYENDGRYHGDDGLEPETLIINYAAWDNRIADSLTFLSLGPVEFGPIYLLNNVGWRQGQVTQPHGFAALVTGAFIKYSGSSSDPPCRLFMIGNTFWSDRASQTGGEDFATSGTFNEWHYVRNNVIRTTVNGYSIPRSPLTRWDSEYNHFATSGDSTRGIKHVSGSTYTTIAAHRARLVVLGLPAGVRDENSNTYADLQDEAALDALFVDPTNGDLTLTAPGQAALAGVATLPQISAYLGNPTSKGAVGAHTAP
jgi:hypothetical protein